MTKSASDNMMTVVYSLHLIRLMLVGLLAWRKTEMQNLTFLSFSMQVYACYRAQSLYTPSGH